MPYQCIFLIHILYIYIHYILFVYSTYSIHLPIYLLPIYLPIHPIIHRFTFSVDLSICLVTSCLPHIEISSGNSTLRPLPSLLHVAGSHEPQTQKILRPFDDDRRRLLGLALAAALDSMLYEQKKHIYRSFTLYR